MELTLRQNMTFAWLRKAENMQQEYNVYFWKPEALAAAGDEFNNCRDWWQFWAHQR